MHFNYLDCKKSTEQKRTRAKKGSRVKEESLVLYCAVSQPCPGQGVDPAHPTLSAQKPELARLRGSHPPKLCQQASLLA